MAFRFINALFIQMKKKNSKEKNEFKRTLRRTCQSHQMILLYAVAEQSRRSWITNQTFLERNKIIIKMKNHEKY